MDDRERARQWAGTTLAFTALNAAAYGCLTQAATSALSGEGGTETWFRWAAALALSGTVASALTAPRPRSAWMTVSLCVLVVGVTSPAYLLLFRGSFVN